MESGSPDSVGKAALRTSVLRRRGERSEADRADAAEAIAAHLLAAQFAQVPTVSAYLSMGSEPGTQPLITALHARGTEVLVPVAGPDQTLEWVRHDPEAPFTRSPIGVPEPGGVRLGPTALADVGLVIVPALAVDHAGWRLGRGAGYFDRALAHAAAPICAVVYADELVPTVPHEDHDVPVDLVVTEAGIFRVP
jgi:5-formyltetrahydrofolate cyclo-ligase